MRIGTCAIGRGGGFRSIRGNGGMWPIGSQSRGIIVPARADPRPFDRSRGFQDGSRGLAELWRGASIPRPHVDAGGSLFVVTLLVVILIAAPTISLVPTSTVIAIA